MGRRQTDTHRDRHTETQEQTNSYRSLQVGTDSCSYNRQTGKGRHGENEVENSNLDSLLVK